MASLVDQIRQAVIRAEKMGLTRYEISRSSGVSQAQLSKLVHRQQGLSVGAVEKLAEALGYRVELKRKKGV